MLKIYTYARCGTCRKAIQYLEGRGIRFQEVPIRETPPTRDELSKMLKAHGEEIRRLFNTSGGDYKEMGMKDRLPSLSEAEALDLLSKHGNLVKRPFVVGDGVWLVGFKPEEWAAAGIG